MGGGRETPKAFPLRGSLFAVPAGFMVLPRALPLGELDAKRPERARPLTETPSVSHSLDTVPFWHYRATSPGRGRLSQWGASGETANFSARRMMED